MKQKFGISQSQIKWVAMIAMFIDHFAVAIVWNMMNSPNYAVEGIVSVGDFEISVSVLNYIYTCMRAVGRISFPIFCLFLVEGFRYTRNVWKYLGRMVLFCIISELPFDLALFMGPFDWKAQNVFCTLTIGLFALILIRFLDEWKHKKRKKKYEMFVSTVFYTGAQCVVALGSMIIANILRTDYSSMGVLTIILMFLISENKIKTALSITFLGMMEFWLLSARTSYAELAIWPVAICIAVYIVSRMEERYRPIIIGNIVLCIMSLAEYTAWFNLVLINRYNEKRGSKLKYVFYLFYPGHLLLLGLLKLWMNF